MKLLEVKDELLQAVKIIHLHAVAAIKAERLQWAVQFLLNANPNLAYRGTMFRVMGIKHPDDWERYLEDSPKLTSFTTSKNFKALLRNLADDDLIGGPEGIIVKQEGEGLDVNAVLETYKHLILDELEIEGEGHYLEHEVIAPQFGATLHRFYADDGDHLFTPKQYDKFRAHVAEWYD